MSGLDFLLLRDPNNWNAETDRHTDGAMSYTSWESLYFKVLGCPDSEYIEGESQEAFRERWRRNFQSAIPEYPMLAKISDFFQDAWYSLEEIAQLRKECLQVQSKTTNADALKGLNGLIAACDEAEKYKLGLFLGAD